uniref:Uncharacterized protein n=1 Tax=Psilocybe cubensis TaxID=181762 RepID=A0A8H7YBJ8_PSICU
MASAPISNEILRTSSKNRDQKDDLIRLDMSQVDPEEERELRWMFDLNLLPPMAFMYLCNALDKGNVGNAKTDGWDKFWDAYFFICEEIFRCTHPSSDDDWICEPLHANRTQIGFIQAALVDILGLDVSSE